MIGSIRHEVRLRQPADEVWALVGDPARLHEWFPGIVGCTVNGTSRVIVTATGLPMPEELLVVDAVQRRLQYRITAPILQHHRGTIDVIELGPTDTLVVYSTEADPRTMALVIGGGTAGALDELRRRFSDAAHPDSPTLDRTEA